MPTLFRLLDLKIVMNGRGREHNPPHVHAYYKDDLAVVDVNSGEVLQGFIPNDQLKIVKKFIGENRERLIQLWNEHPQNFEGFRNGMSKD